MVPALAVVASIALLTQQTLAVWLISIGYPVVGSVLFLVSRAGRKRLDAEPRATTPAG